MRLLCLQLALLAGSIPASAQSELPDDVLQLSRLKRDVKARLNALTNYTCLETIQRSRRRNVYQQFQFVDSVRVEVAVIGDRELYSWPGANQFGDKDLVDMVSGGMISSGTFASAMKSVFVNGGATIEWRGAEDLLGRRALRWDYSIPYNLSAWYMRSEGRQEKVAETGSFWADAQSLELLRLEAVAVEIPPALPIKAASNSFDYARVHVGSRDLLLPQDAEILVTARNGAQSRNLLEFSHCREFQTETRLTFEEPAPADKPASELIELSIPAGLRFSARLAKPIDSQAAVVGDPVNAEIVSPVEYRGKLVVPKGAILRGRIRRFERYRVPRTHWLVGLEFTDIEFPGHHARFFGDMTRVAPAPGLTLRSPASEPKDVGLGGSVSRSRAEDYQTIEIPGVGTLFVEGAAFRLPEGLLMEWRSVALAQ